MSEPALIADGAGFRLRVRLTPGASCDRIDGPGADSAGTPYLAARVRARPENGRANAALESLLARALGAPKSAIRVERGQTARIKTVAVAAGADALSTARGLLQTNTQPHRTGERA